jgi:hypothetical protein
MGMNAVAEVATGELAQAGLGSEVFFADSREIDLVHGTERAKPAETFARRAATELETMLHVIQRERLLSAEEKAINFTDGTWQREDTEDTNKKRNGLELEGTESSGDRLKVFFPFGWRFV